MEVHAAGKKYYFQLTISLVCLLGVVSTASLFPGTRRYRKSDGHNVIIDAFIIKNRGSHFVPRQTFPLPASCFSFFQRGHRAGFLISFTFDYVPLTSIPFTVTPSVTLYGGIKVSALRGGFRNPYYDCLE